MDPMGVEDINMVYADMYWPEVAGFCNAEVEVELEANMSLDEALYRFSTAANAGMVAFNGFTESEVYEEIIQGSAVVYRAKYYLEYCDDPAGDYCVEVTAQDNSNGQGTLENYFTYLPVCGIETDFTSINYGGLLIDVWRQIDGDTNWDDAVVNHATVRSVGNVNSNLWVTQDDMGFGSRLVNGQLVSNVEFWARLGNGANGTKAYYGPNEETMLPDVLSWCSQNKLDFGIRIQKNPGGPYVGNLHLCCTNVDLFPCNETVG
jgi:hypothetical protein